MAYDEATAARIRALLLRDGHELTEKKMFGGLCFMVAGHMCCGLTTTELMLRVGKPAYPTVIALPHARPMTFTGRPMDGFIYVDPAGYTTDKALAAWLARGLAYVATLPRRVADKPSRTIKPRAPAAAVEKKASATAKKASATAKKASATAKKTSATAKKASATAKKATPTPGKRR